MTARYVISNINNVTVPVDASTTPSRYPVLTYKSFRKFATRSAARSYKQSRKNPQQYAIIDLATAHVVR